MTTTSKTVGCGSGAQLLWTLFPALMYVVEKMESSPFIFSWRRHLLLFASAFLSVKDFMYILNNKGARKSSLHDAIEKLPKEPFTI